MARSLSKRFLERCETLGFTQPYVADLSDWSSKTPQRLTAFLKRNYQGDMTWLADTEKRRSDPRNMWAQARSAIVLGMNYGPDVDPLDTLSETQKATISVYARNRDYHDIMKGRLKELAGLLARELGSDVKVFVDTAPLMEKPLAQMAGMGWQGKHTNLVSREYGSWLFIGSILTNAKLPATEAGTDHCGTCRACLDICPTNAFPEPYQLDARKCISYLTIEYDGIVTEALRSKMGNRIYGCDDCLAVCPWNKYAQLTREMKLAARDELKAPDLAELVNLDDSTFRQKFSGSPIKRIGRNRFIRNVLYAIGNSGRTELRDLALPYEKDDDPVLADAASWALKSLSAPI